MKRHRHVALCPLLAVGFSAFLACSGGSGGGSPSSSDTTLGLTYTNPVSGQYQLVRDSASTRTHLVLDLVGSAPITLSGIGFHLTADTTEVTWSTVGSNRVSSSLFTSPLVKTQVAGDAFQAGVYQLGSTPAITVTAGEVLASIALDLKDGLNLPAGTVINLAAPAGKALILKAPGTTPATAAITLSVGTLMAN